MRILIQCLRCAVKKFLRKHINVMRATQTLTILFFILCSLLSAAQTMDDKIKNVANEIADQVVKNGRKKIAVASLTYKDCPTEFGSLLAEKLTGRLSVSGRNVTVVNQKMLEALMVQNRLTAKGLLEAKNEAAKLGQVSGIDALVYGTISSLGEEIQLTLNIIALPTLNVFGFSESSFPLTTGIKNMLPCLTTNRLAYTESSNIGDGTPPQPSSNCKAENTCVVCVTNKSAMNVKAIGTWAAYQSYYIHPDETKCWLEVPIHKTRDYADIRVIFRDDNNHNLKLDNFTVEACQTYKRVFTK